MASGRAVSRISLTLSILSWIALVFTDLTILFSRTNQISSGIAVEVPYLLRSAFFISLFVFFKFRIEKAENVNFVDLLWKVFVTGLLTTIASLSLQSIELLIGRLAENIFIINLQYLINLALGSAFVISTFVVWKRLILYQKSKYLLRGWLVFEYGLFISLAFDFLPESIFYQVYTIIMIILIIMGLVFSVNMKWVAYLNFRQKWKSILLILLTILYLGYFYINTTNYDPNTLTIIFHHKAIFIQATYFFIFIYSIFSVLVVLFNLPTSSVFEQKLGEVVNYQRLSQSIHNESSEEKVYEILLESSISTVFADAGWVEIMQSNHRAKESDTPIQYSPYAKDLSYYRYQIEEDEIKELKTAIQKNKVLGLFDFSSTDKSINHSRFLNSIRQGNFKSIISVPIQVQQNTIGALVLLKDVSDGFNKEMAEITHTFVNQAGISIENFRLLTAALENERYKEELKIAKNVQNSLLPEILDTNTDCDIVAFSKAADEVGGDYYDTYRINKDKIALIIGDVSGKGTSAAFNMSQMKGVFHSLSQMDPAPKDFFVYANKALSNCLEKTSFITASYFVIDQAATSVSYARAGHCPTLYYNSAKKSVEYFENKGMGLGILRDDQYKNYMEESTFQYQPGDVMVLYTDGITEASNFKKEEYGYDRMMSIITNHAHEHPNDIRQNLIDDLFSFSSEDDINDDYTLVIIKFK